MKLTITADTDQVERYLTRIARRTDDLTPVMKIIGSIVRTSVVRNFEKEGRPEKWEPLKPSTLAQRKKGKKKTGILRVQGMRGGLMGSINFKAHRDRVEVGTNKIYAAVHQFGRGPYVIEPKDKKALYWPGCAHPVRRVNHPGLPARPFLMVQDEDWTEIRDSLLEYLLRMET